MPTRKQKEEPEEAMSAFERMRQENIARNQSLLKDLAQVSNKMMPAKPKPAPKPRSAPVKKEAVEAPAGPVRRSARVAGLDADNETLKRKYEVELEDQAAKEKAKKKRVGGTLSLGDIAVEGKKFNKGIDGLGALVPRGAQPGVPTFTDEDVENTSDKDLKDLRKKMGKLELYDKWIPNDIKICPQRIYASTFHPTEEKAVIFAGDKEGALGVFDASQDGPPESNDDDEEEAEWKEPEIGAYKIHARTITTIIVSPFDNQKVYTSSYDSTVRVLDLAKDMCVPVWEPADKEEDVPLSAIDIPLTDQNLIYFSTLDGAVGRVDIRDPKGTETWSLSDNKIGGFSLNPREPHLLATASLDRTVKIWDLRKITGKGEMRFPAMLYEHNSRLSVSHASWSPGGHIATSSYDDTIKIYNWSDHETWDSEGMEPANIVKHNNQTGRWVTILKPQWQKRPQDGIQKFTIGNMNRFVDVYAANGEQLAQLGGDGISAVPAVAQFHPTMDWVAGGTASGKLCLWM
ncbi:WD repeat domain-containing protein [Colletotrichum higginsianum]|uniref:DNA damage-binding protein CMR1 n=2 Tax=Colletotrichum higginsianum TaxID=80884 RepID=H1VHB5_COLHI|nr:WD repeat domain-containing protein [Colletotrichum higginsianum IMI 349063]OBR16550.1 WD repeat domain-containing protein [Colletotrichum higginsianum IMI 349063]TID05155.1 DNA damage-binding protein cmr1 [Colletotrichum higginsianum]GJC91220.1 WD repeat domain-containing protein [Colletotrichum higginsianum]CCF39618.1 WD repeat domain-containing protein [Colletotrichum higginsianum]